MQGLESHFASHFTWDWGHAMPYPNNGKWEAGFGIVTGWLWTLHLTSLSLFPHLSNEITLGNGFRTHFNLVTLCSNKSHKESPRYKTSSVSPPLDRFGGPEPLHIRVSLITYMVLHKGLWGVWKSLDQMNLEVHSSSEKSKIYKPCFVLIAPGQYQLLTSLLKY